MVDEARFAHGCDGSNDLSGLGSSGQGSDHPRRQIRRRQTAAGLGSTPVSDERLVEHFDSCLDHPGLRDEVRARR